MTFFNRLATLMSGKPTVAADAAMVDRLAMLGLKVGEPFCPLRVGGAAIHAAVKVALDKLVTAAKSGRGWPLIHGWTVHKNLGRYATERHRSLIAWSASARTSAPMRCIRWLAWTWTPAAQRRQPIRLHFDKSQVPPVNAFLVTDDVQRQASVRAIG